MGVVVLADTLKEVISDAKTPDEIKEIRNVLRKYETEIPYFSRTRSTLFNKPVSNHWKLIFGLLDEKEALLIRQDHVFISLK